MEPCLEAFDCAWKRALRHDLDRRAVEAVSNEHRTGALKTGQLFHDQHPPGRFFFGRSASTAAASYSCPSIGRGRPPNTTKTPPKRGDSASENDGNLASSLWVRTLPLSLQSIQLDLVPIRKLLSRLRAPGQQHLFNMTDLVGVRHPGFVHGLLPQRCWQQQVLTIVHALQVAVDWVRASIQRPFTSDVRDGTLTRRIDGYCHGWVVGAAPSC
jgi:hypothetical protein